MSLPPRPTRPPPTKTSEETEPIEEAIPLEAIEVSKTYDGHVLAKVENASVWKIVDKKATFLSNGEIAIIKTKVGKSSVVYLQFIPKAEEPAPVKKSKEDEEGSEPPPHQVSAEVSEEVKAEIASMFPCPLKDDIPVTKHSRVYFVFPTVEFSESIFIGVKLDSKDEGFEKFVTALELCSELIESKNLQQAKSRATKLERYADKGAGLIKAASLKAGEGIEKLGGFLKQKIKPKENETKMSAGAKNAAKAVAITAEKGVQISGTVVQMVGVMTQSMSEALVDGVQSQDSYQKLRSKIFKSKKPPSSTMQQAKVIAGSAIVGYAMLVDAMFAAAETVLEQAADTTVDVIGHRHGKEAAQVSKDASQGAVDGVKTGLNLVKIGPKSVIKTAAKTAGKELIKDAL